MSFLIEAIVEAIFEGIFSFIDYPGAWLHWLIRGKKITYPQVVERYFGINLLLSLLAYGIIGVTIWQMVGLLR